MDFLGKGCDAHVCYIGILLCFKRERRPVMTEHWEDESPPCHLLRVTQHVTKLASDCRGNTFLANSVVTGLVKSSAMFSGNCIYAMNFHVDINGNWHLL